MAKSIIELCSSALLQLAFWSILKQEDNSFLLRYLEIALLEQVECVCYK